MRRFDSNAARASSASPPKLQSTCLIVLGMHRSGTSALTRVLNLAGAALPTRLMPAGFGNEAGHWESQALVDYHDKLLASLGSKWDDWRAVDLNRLSLAARRDAISDISRIIEEEYSNADVFVLKDPRICRFAPLVFDALAARRIAVAPVIVFRNPIEVIESLQSRSTAPEFDLNRANCALLWLRHVLDAEFATRTKPRAVVSYDSLLYDWRAVLDCLSAHARVEFQNCPDDNAGEINTFLSSERRHWASSSQDLIRDPMLRNWVAIAYAALEKLERRPLDPGAISELDRVRNAFDDAAPILDALKNDAVHELARRRSTSSQLEHELARQSEEFYAKELAYKNSVSWRITAPLRTVRRTLATAFVATTLAVQFAGGLLWTARKALHVLMRKRLDRRAVRAALVGVEIGGRATGAPAPVRRPST